MFENDLSYSAYTNRVYVVGTHTLANKSSIPDQPLSRQAYLYVNDFDTGYEFKREIPGAAGSKYNIVIRNAGPNGVRIILFGGGKYFISDDEGTTWVSGSNTNYEIPGYPKSQYSYIHTSTMKPKSGTEALNNDNSIMLLESVRHRQTGAKSVIAVDFTMNN